MADIHGVETIGVHDLLASAALEHGANVAIVESAGRSRTWRELDDEASLVATGLHGEGVVAGFRVLIAMANRIEFVTSYLGALRAGAVAVPVNPRSTPDELARMIADSGARVVLTDDAAVAGVRAAAEQLAERPRVIVVGQTEGDEQTYEGLIAVAPRPVPTRRDPEALAVLLYTSGTSGRPRGVMLSHRALLANIDQVAAVEPPMIGHDDVVLGVLPLFHVYGLNAVLGTVLRQRARLVLVDGFDPQATLDLIDDEAISVLPVAPPVFTQWLGLDELVERLGPVRLVLSGSAPLSAEVVEEFVTRTGIPVHQGYGLTEAAPVVTSTLCRADGAQSTGADAARAGSVGAAVPGVRLRLVADGGGEADGQDAGEVEIAGDNLFSGYWPDGSDGPDEDGWWATGDVGFLDGSGDLFLVDRVKELILVSGFNVYPSEVEDVIAEVDGVAGVAVIGAADEATGESVVAYVRATGTVADDDLVAAVAAHCDRRLARFKRPARIDVVDELPRTVTGKVQKGRLRAAERRRALSLLEGPR